MVGVQTVLHDNPFLTTRLPHGGKNPIRIILDRHIRKLKTANVVTDGAAETIILHSIQQSRVLLLVNILLFQLIGLQEKCLFFVEVLKRLAHIGIIAVFVEGGSRVISDSSMKFLAVELYLYMASKLIGNGATLFMNDTRNLMAEGESLRFLDAQQIGG